ncbi:MAG: beta-ketoacyl-ACP reductase [Planctomycetota bacterium]|nr:MAG: beta-ketoacyl-ACP reductase [Planctomycetota bacterium]
MNFDFTGQTVIVTGGTRGLGKAFTKLFLENKATVIATYAGNIQAAESLKSEFSEHSDKLQTIKFDVSKYEEVKSFFKDFDQNHEKLDVLINNSGIRKDNILAGMDPMDWNDVINTNLTGTFNMCKYGVISMMRNRYGRIINISSPCSHYGFQGQSNYAASKAGQIGLTRSLSKEVAKRKITVNTISPGFIETELIEDLDPKLVEEYKKMIPMKRFGTTEEVASLVGFLASPESTYITGSNFDIGGGL